MTPYLIIRLVFIFSFLNGIVAVRPLLAQEQLDDAFPQEEMLEDLQVFRNIREAANSGLYKYRSTEEIDSAYQWAADKVAQSSTYRDFYNIILALTDFEGSLHNDTELPKKVLEAMKAEGSGYFPYPIKIISGRVLINFDNGDIPLGAEIVSINGESIGDILPNLYEYYTTDGFNLTGKALGINKNFSKYYRLHYGGKSNFKISFNLPQDNKEQIRNIKGVSYAQYYQNFKQRHSALFDRLTYELSIEEMIAAKGAYNFMISDDSVAILTVNHFLIGWNAEDEKHKKYQQFLDSVFTVLADKKIQNLVVDIRTNGGGTGPNDMVTFSYLASNSLPEIKSAWVRMNSVPYWKYIELDIFSLLKPIARLKYRRELKKEFPIEKEGKFYYQNIEKVGPSHNAYQGRIYLLISPRIASAGSQFAALVAGNTDAIVVGEETQGGYYGHNGIQPISYRLPNSGITTTFSIVNLEQSVPTKGNQPVGSGVRPDYQVSQSFNDFMNNKDTQMKFTLDLIKKHSTK